MSKDKRARRLVGRVPHLHDCGDPCPCDQLMEPLCVACELAQVVKRRYSADDLTNEEAFARLVLAVATLSEAAG